MTSAVREQVRSRAGERCEYCRLPQRAVAATFHVEHVRAVQHGGLDNLENLALACDRCNLFKGTNLASIDPVSGNMVALFHPRKQIWTDHFTQEDFEVLGITDVGRATLRLLNMNAPRRLQLRRLLGVDLLSR